MSSDNIAIICSGLSKQYRIGERESYKALRDVITDAAAAPFRRLRSILSNGNGSSVRDPNSEIRNSFWALDDVSFEVKRGEVVGIIGRNGAGKSTLLKILSRITKPTSGHAKIHGRVGSLLEVGTGFHPELTGRENIYLNAAILGMRRKEVERKFDEIVAFAEVEKFIDTPVKRYSSGMYVRLAFAVAAHMETEILLVDEVLAVGDAAFQKKCLGKMGDVSHAGRTIFFVSHNTSAIEQLCTSAMLLDKGQLVKFSKTVPAVTRQYLSFQSSERTRTCWINRDEEHANQWFKPLSFRLVDGEGKELLMPVSNDSTIWLEIEAEVEDIDPSLSVGYVVSTDSGQVVYHSYQTDTAESEWPTLTKGKCTLKSKIPERLLNEGSYRIELIASLYCRQWLFERGSHAPTVNLTIQGRLSESPYWTTRRPGVLAPCIEWIRSE